MKSKDITKLLSQGKIGVIPTDTIYGLVGSALNQKTVERIYKLRKRTTNKPMIILISSLDDLKKFNVLLTEKQKEFLNRYWPNPLSVVLSCPGEKWKYLHRGTNSLAFRIPKNDELREILKQTGSLVAPSANFEGGKPSETIDQAKKCFGDEVEFYVDGGQIKLEPSTLIQLNENGSFIVLRKGLFKV